MASHKVAQNVEAEDKLLGPLTARQAIYLAVALGGAALMWFLFSLFPPLAIIPLPIVLLFGTLALPLRKDQPMEVYLAALISYYLKPKVRLWKKDGIANLIEITAPRIQEEAKIGKYSEVETDQRLIFLSDIADTQGWSVRNAVAPADPTQTSMQADSYYDAMSTSDVLDNSSRLAQNFDSMISQSNMRHREEMIAQMQQPVSQPTSPQPVAPYIPPPTPDPVATPEPEPGYRPFSSPEPEIHFNPYPDAIRQSVIQPQSDHKAHVPADNIPITSQNTNNSSVQYSEPLQTENTSSQTPISPDIINLANNTDLTVATIAREAERITKKDSKKHKQSDDGEVFISLH